VRVGDRSSAEARHTWFTAGRMRALVSRSWMSGAVKLDTPMALTRPSSTSFSMAAQVSWMETVVSILDAPGARTLEQPSGS
jgi:hypothetical protein